MYKRQLLQLLVRVLLLPPLLVAATAVPARQLLLLQNTILVRRRGPEMDRVAISTVSDPSGSAQVDMLTGPAAAARAVVATGAG